MSLKICLRLASNFAINPSKPINSFLLASTPPNNLLRHSSTVSPIFAEYHRKRKKQWKKGPKPEDEPPAEDISDSSQSKESPEAIKSAAADLLYTIPELVPTSFWGHRDSVRESLERTDLAKRRTSLKIPEFYVGSIMSVTVADNLSPTKQTKFVGLCIAKGEPGLRHRFVLRNMIDDQGVEVMYEIYNPMIRDITVLKLEKRLDDELYYLRDALPEYSIVPFDMKPVPRAANEPIPVNETTVRMKPLPWTAKWETGEFKGIDESTVGPQLSEPRKHARLSPMRHRMWEKFDLQLQYRHSITKEETNIIYEDAVGRFDRSRDMEALPQEERPIITRKKARKV